MQGPDLEFEGTSASGIVWSGFIRSVWRHFKM